MSRHHQEMALQRSTTTYRANRKVTPSTYTRSTSSIAFLHSQEIDSHNLILRPTQSSPISSFQRLNKLHLTFSSVLRSLFSFVAFPTIISPTTCKWITVPSQLSLGRKVTGTLFGHRRGHVTFAVQDDPRYDPVLLLELAMSTSTLVREMSSGLVRIALECEKVSQNGGRSGGKLFHQPLWTMYCNGRKCGYAVTRTCTETDWHVLGMVRSVSIGAGVIPAVEDGRKKNGVGGDGELVYMRAKFERVVGSRDSEAFYMLNPDNNGGPELSIFLLRV
ncbi:protein MIZU-KUSSEI 1 [Carica papaya]|uniref:protein MIZU-KUSSEI 1 n=1 Tax=Carica papaya TaxID=3649 RepID=UPI000B8CD5E7|nr:protein MIZU-KUSSEI 1 [Carica papaya]